MTTTDQAIDLVRRYTQFKDIDELDVIFTSDFINHSTGGIEKGLDKFKNFVTKVGGLIHDGVMTIEKIFADKVDNSEPWVGALITLRGTRSDNNQPLELQEFWIFQFRDGKIAERRYVVDRKALSGQVVSTQDLNE